jgi:hypothetical protein
MCCWTALLACPDSEAEGAGGKLAWLCFGANISSIPNDCQAHQSMHPDGSLAVIANVQYPGVEEESVLFLLGIFSASPNLFCRFCT